MDSFFKSNRQGLVIALILALTFFIYIPSLGHQFVNWDDNTHITDNPQIRSLSPENIVRIFTSTLQKTYIPLTTFSLALDYQLVGLKPFLYHLNNVLLHLLVVFLLFRLSLALGLNWKGGAIAAFIFALHPMHVESVVWATERKDVLYSAFYLGAVLCYLNFLKTGKKSGFAWSLFLGFLSMLAKPMALSLPLILLMCDWFLKGSLKKEDWLNKLPYFVFIVPLTWITFSINIAVVTTGTDPWSSVLFRFWSAAFYLKKFFWPDLLVPMYLPPLPPAIFHMGYWSAFLIVLFSICIFFLASNRWLRLAFLWYILSIFFLLNFDYGKVMTMVADRYMYLPSAGFCFLVGYWTEKHWSRFSLWLPIGLAVVGFIFIVKTSFQIGVWKDSFSLWNYTVQHSPGSFLAYNNRGRIYERRQELSLAMADYQEAIRINPKFAKTHKNIGMIYEAMGETEAAIAAYSKAIELNPRYSGAYNNRALLLEKREDFEGAFKDYTAAIAGEPGYSLGFGNRGALLLRSGDVEQAVADLSQAIKLNPNYSEAYSNRAACYMQMDLWPQALQDCQKAVQLNPSHPTAHFLCSAIYKKMEKYDKALFFADRSRKLGYPLEESYINELILKLPQ